MKVMLSQAKAEGWNINEEVVTELFGIHQNDSDSSIKILMKELLNYDLKEIVSSSVLSDCIKGKLKVSQLPTPFVLQVSNVRNVSAPKANEESGTAPRLLKFTLTDGNTYIDGLEIEPIPFLSFRTPPGTKIKLVSKVAIMNNFLLLNPSNVQLLGGHVEELYNKWKMSQSVSKYSRNTISSDGSGPPRWVPFGQKIIEKQDSNFRSIEDKESGKGKEEDAFECQRKQVVQEIAQGSSQKVFGGGKQMLDTNVQKIMDAGFTMQDATWALRKNRNDANRALHELRNKSGNAYDNSFNGFEDKSKRAGRRGRGRRRRGDPDSDEDYPVQNVNSRPSAPASLLDYLEPTIQTIIINEQPERSYRGGAGIAEPRQRESHNYSRHRNDSDGYATERSRGSRRRGSSSERDFINQFDKSLDFSSHRNYPGIENRPSSYRYEETYQEMRHSPDDFYGSVEFRRGGRSGGSHRGTRGGQLSHGTHNRY